MEENTQAEAKGVIMADKIVFVVEGEVPLEETTRKRLNELLDQVAGLVNSSGVVAVHDASMQVTRDWAKARVDLSTVSP